MYLSGQSVLVATLYISQLFTLGIGNCWEIIVLIFLFENYCALLNVSFEKTGTHRHDELRALQ